MRRGAKPVSAFLLLVVSLGSTLLIVSAVIAFMTKISRLVQDLHEKARIEASDQLMYRVRAGRRAIEAEDKVRELEKERGYREPRELCITCGKPLETPCEAPGVESHAIGNRPPATRPRPSTNGQTRIE
jgi:hypothetical protein